ncbi:MAG TPA: asparagine synthase (glutamine-hydrolyzing) [Candidatus Desulfobacillus sp.]|nr:asparagine synthase (glutamine-hydrolyzing) [Candidatus Desulfobacillus sp.]
MCGLAGFLAPTAAWPEERAAAVAQAMAASLAHRGPDDAGVWTDAAAGFALGHRRLSIVDLSPGGHQPMVSADGRFVLAFNGEIYNHADLRRELMAAGCRFRSGSDTEVLLEAVARWGAPAACRRLLGMFAFAAWDRRERRLWLARDRLGKKPLYVHRDGRGGLAFASELKALWRYPGFSPRIDPAALAEYFRFSYVADHLCIFRNVAKLMPGTLLEAAPGQPERVLAYWSLAEAAARGAAARIDAEEEAEAALLELLRDATRRRMLADVPLGAFLSGGVDSGLVVALMQEANLGRVRTFSIGFAESAFDEAPVARAVAARLGTDHAELYVSDADAQRVVPQLPEIFDEPFADASQIPTALLSRLARDQVTVALTGDGGDESFGGYLRYRSQYGLAGRLCALPRPVRGALAAALAMPPAGFWDAATALLPARRRPRVPASKAAKLARALRLDDAAERGKAYLSFWDPAEVLRLRPPAPAGDPFAWPAGLAGEASERMQYWETLHYLPGDLLVKIDRASMAAALETRAPLLDHRVVELAWRLPPAMKASPRATKRILRRLLSRYLPPELVDLPKQGFSAPIGAWMAGGLRDWVEAMLAWGRAEAGELIDWAVVDAAWRRHLAGQIGHVEKLWIVVMFCAWHRRWLGAGREGRR